MLKFIIKTWTSFLRNFALSVLSIICYYFLSNYQNGVPIEALLQVLIFFFISAIVENILLNQEIDYGKISLSIRGFLFWIYICAALLIIVIGINQVKELKKILLVIGIATFFYIAQLSLILYTNHREAKKLMSKIEQYQKRHEQEEH